MRIILLLLTAFGAFPMLGSFPANRVIPADQVAQFGNVITAHGTGDGAHLQFLEEGQTVILVFEDGTEFYTVVSREVVSIEAYFEAVQYPEQYIICTCVVGGVMVAKLEKIEYDKLSE